MLEKLHQNIAKHLKRRTHGLIKPQTVTDAINSASEDLWLELIDKLKNGDASDLLNPFKVNTSITGGAGTATGWGDYVVLSGKTASDREVILATTDKQWTTNNPADVIADITGIKHLLDSDHTETSVSPITLPSNYFGNYGVFYLAGKEGQILDHNEYMDRKNSAIIAPDANNPIGRIRDGQLEFLPADSAAVTIPYVGFPSVKMPMVRFTVSGSDKSMEVRPSSYAENTTIYGLKPPVTATATYTLSSHGEVTLSSITDLDWDSEAYTHIFSRALFYLGHTTQDQQVTALEANKEAVEKNAGK